MSVSYVVAPAMRQRGFGRALINALMARPDLADVHTFWAGIEEANMASRACAESVGFARVGPDPLYPKAIHYRREPTGAAVPMTVAPA